jgi:hypothetical protein
MWSSWVKRKGTIQVMHIGKIKDGSKRVKKTFSIIMGLTRLTTLWRGSVDSSDGWMTLNTCKRRCKLPLTHRSACCMTSLATSGLTQMLKSCKDLSLEEVPGA